MQGKEIANIVEKSVTTEYRRHLKDRTEGEAKATSVLCSCYDLMQKHGIKWTDEQFFDNILEAISVFGVKYLPKTQRHFKQKLKMYADGYPLDRLVYAKNKGNQNASLVNRTGNEELESVVLELAESQQNYSAATISRLLSQYKPPFARCPSMRWVQHYLAKPSTKFLIQERYGKNSYQNRQYKEMVLGQRAENAGDCWMIDGSRVNIVDHRDPEGKSRFLYVIIVYDSMSGAILGRHYCYKETSEAFISAVNIAAKETGYLPYELRYDRFPGHNHKDWLNFEHKLQKMGVKTMITSDADMKAGAERVFGTVQTVVMQQTDLYYGEGIKSRRSSGHRNLDYVAKIRKNVNSYGFDFNAAVEYAERIYDIYNNLPLSSYSRKYKHINLSADELHETSAKTNVIKYAEHQFAYLFGLKRTTSVRNQMLITSINSTEYIYGIDDVEVIEKYTGRKLDNYINLENTEEIHSYTGDQYLGTWSRIERVQLFGPNPQMKSVGIMNKINKETQEHRQKLLVEKKQPKPKKIKESKEEIPDYDEVNILLGGKVPKEIHNQAEEDYLLNMFENSIRERY
jgi:hypothetical protein